MKSEKGVTLISLIVYITTLLIVITVITIVSSYFYQNIDLTLSQIDPLVEYTRFNSYFTEEINYEDIEILESGTLPAQDGTHQNDYIVFSNGIQYTFMSENNAIYRNTAKIVGGVKSCDFEVNSEKNKISVRLDMESGDKEWENDYIINN